MNLLDSTTITLREMVPDLRQFEIQLEGMIEDERDRLEEAEKLPSSDFEELHRAIAILKESKTKLTHIADELEILE